MKNIKANIILIALTGGLIFHQHATAQYKVSSSVFSNGGSQITSSSYRIIGTVGQPVIGVVSSSAHINEVGFWYQSAGLITSVEQTSTNLPTEYRLEQNYPNPFNPTTTIQFALPKCSTVTLKLFDMLGREVATLLDEELQPGEYKVFFSAQGGSASGGDAGVLSTGMYFYRLQAEGFVQTKKLLLLK